jgi:hypothetical protein
MERVPDAAPHRAGGQEHPCDRHPPQRPRSDTARRIDSADPGALSSVSEFALARLCEGYGKAWIDHATTLSHGRDCDKTFSLV